MGLLLSTSCARRTHQRSVHNESVLLGLIDQTMNPTDANLKLDSLFSIHCGLQTRLKVRADY